MAVIVNLLSKFDDSGIKKAKKSFGGLKSALGAVGLTLGLKALTNELSQAVKNAQADVISQKQLARQLKITANATDQQVSAQEDYISKLSMTTGVVDDQLRPAFSILLRATGSVTKAQDLLGLSLDTSAGTGKNLETVTKSIARAYGGNVTGLQKLVPGIKKGADAMGFLRKQFAGARETLANPFDQLQIAVDETTEKIGMLLLPHVQKFAKFIIEEVVPNVEKFLDDVSNPKTEAGKTFIQIKDAVQETINAVKDFFAFFGDGDAVKGFANVASSLIKMLPALLAFKGILMLASAGKSIANLAKAIGLMVGAGAAGQGGNVVAGGAGKGSAFKKLIGLPVIGTAAAILATPGSTPQAGMTPEQLAADYQRRKSLITPSGTVPSFIKPQKPVTNNITINVPNADPKASVNAWKQYANQNGGVNSILGTR